MADRRALIRLNKIGALLGHTNILSRIVVLVKEEMNKRNYRSDFISRS